MRPKAISMIGQSGRTGGGVEPAQMGRSGYASGLGGPQLARTYTTGKPRRSRFR
jgi:hypothetical protein